ncbi:hypothetical protein PENTCL1PPCAC_13681, partial [Pristionchus entomophagus]
FHDLPDELLLKIGKYVGSKNRMKLRVDKRMDERVLTLLKLDDINFREYGAEPAAMGSVHDCPEHRNRFACEYSGCSAHLCA